MSRTGINRERKIGLPLVSQRMMKWPIFLPLMLLPFFPNSSVGAGVGPEDGQAEAGKATDRRYPSLPGAVHEIPAWMAKNAPFDVAAYFKPVHAERRLDFPPAGAGGRLIASASDAQLDLASGSVGPLVGSGAVRLRSARATQRTPRAGRRLHHTSWLTPAARQTHTGRVARDIISRLA